VRNGGKIPHDDIEDSEIDSSGEESERTKAFFAEVPSVGIVTGVDEAYVGSCFALGNTDLGVYGFHIT